MNRRIFQYALIALMGASLLVQTGRAVQTFDSLSRNKVWPNRNLPAVERSADNFFGADFMKIIRTLRANIPEEETVLIPPNPGKKFNLDDKFIMQFFLMPRRIVTCNDDCQRLINSPSTYVIAWGAFPPVDSIPSSKTFLPITSDIGLYVPEQQ